MGLVVKVYFLHEELFRIVEVFGVEREPFDLEAIHAAVHPDSEAVFDEVVTFINVSDDVDGGDGDVLALVVA